MHPLATKNNLRIRSIEPDDVKARIIKRGFEEYANGNHTYVSLAQYLADLRLATRKGTPLAKVSIKKLLTNRAYHGNFELIVSPQLFDAVQEGTQRQ